MNIDQQDLAEQQRIVKQLQDQGLTRQQIAEKTGLTFKQVRRRLDGWAKIQRLDPQVAEELRKRGISDAAGLHSGWILQKEKDGSGTSLYFHLGQDQERIDFAEAMREVLTEDMRLPPITAPQACAEDVCNFVALADLHVGRNYNHSIVEADFAVCVDDLVARLPAARKAVLVELGDLLDANDHKGVTPSSGNPCDVIRHDHLANTLAAVRIMKRAIYRLAETHSEVEVHMVRGNHDETAYIAVMLALHEAFHNSPHVNIVVSDHEYRVIEWGGCGLFPNHGDKAKWGALKDTWADQFPQAWARCGVHRAIWTAHLHHYKEVDLVGVTAKHFRTVARRQQWEKEQAYFSRGTLSAETWHKTAGKIGGTDANIIGKTLEELQA
jgi:hypothetical protein